YAGPHGAWTQALEQQTENANQQQKISNGRMGNGGEQAAAPVARAWGNTRIDGMSAGLVADGRGGMLWHGLHAGQCMPASGERCGEGRAAAYQHDGQYRRCMAWPTHSDVHEKPGYR